MTTPRKVSADIMAARLQKTLAQNVKRTREQLGMTQRELAAAIGTSQRRILMIEAADGNPTILTLARLGSCLNQTVPELLTPIPRNPPP